MAEEQQVSQKPRGTRALWAAVLGAPVLWAVHLQLTYFLAAMLCQSKRLWVLHVTTLAFLLVTAIGAGVSRREWRRATTLSAEEIGRTRFLAQLGLMSSTLFFLIILATGLPPLFFDPCQD